MTHLRERCWILVSCPEGRPFPLHVQRGFMVLKRSTLRDKFGPLRDKVCYGDRITEERHDASSIQKPDTGSGDSLPL